MLLVAGFLHILLAQHLAKAEPSMAWTECPHGYDLCLNVDFEYESDVAILNQKYEGNDCIFEGTFANAPNVRVFVSSEDCPIDEFSFLQVSFIDPRSPDQHLFNVDPNAGFAYSEIVFGGDNITDDVMLPPSGLPERNGPPNDRLLLDRIDPPTYPAGGFVLKLIVLYDNDFAAQFGADAVTRIQAVLGHAQTIYNFGSLLANMKLEIQSIEAFNGVVEATGADLETLRDGYLATTETRSPDLFAFFTFKNNAAGTVGIAWLGTVCLSDANRGYRASINEYFQNDLTTAEILAHEIGHNLNMEHDFDPNPGDVRTCAFDSDNSGCTNIGSVMDYFQPTIDKWSCCSNSDFANYYVPRQNSFCLQVNEVTTTAAPTTTTAAPTTTTAAPTTTTAAPTTTTAAPTTTTAAPTTTTAAPTTTTAAPTTTTAAPTTTTAAPTTTTMAPTTTTMAPTTTTMAPTTTAAPTTTTAAPTTTTAAPTTTTAAPTTTTMAPTTTAAPTTTTASPTTTTTMVPTTTTSVATSTTTTTTTTTKNPNCENKWSDRTCRRLKRRGWCRWKAVRRNCKETCSRKCRTPSNSSNEDSSDSDESFESSESNSFGN